VEVIPGREERPIFVASSVDAACLAVRNWLEAFQPASANGNGDGPVTWRG
jgi:hypothetical protein